MPIKSISIVVGPLRSDHRQTKEVFGNGTCLGSGTVVVCCCGLLFFRPAALWRRGVPDSTDGTGARVLEKFRQRRGECRSID